MWRVKYYDGSKSEGTFATQAEAVTEARKGIRDWMNDDDGISQLAPDDNGSVYLFVAGGSEGDSDAWAKAYKVKESV